MSGAASCGHAVERGEAYERLDAVRRRASFAADRAGWRWDRDGRHPVFAATRDEVLVMIREAGIEPSRRQIRTLDWLCDDDIDTVTAVLELILAGRQGSTS